MSNKYVAFLRGINVGGRRKILMADLKVLYQNLGYSNIVTYIQSGNVLFDSDTKESPKEMCEKITQAIKAQYDFDVPVIIRSVEEIEYILENNPFMTEEEGIINKLHLTFLSAIPAPENVEIAKSFDFSPDVFEIIGNNVFIYVGGSYHKTKLSNQFFEKKLKVRATNRNWKTVRKLKVLT